MSYYDVPQVINNYYLEDNLGSGYSGSIYRAVHIHTGHTVALKIQDVDHECPTNRYERHIYPSLQGGEGMPNLWASGVSGKWDFLVIDLLGPSIDQLFRRTQHACMDLKSVCCLAIQLLQRLEFMHSRGILHRDINPANCTIGLPPNDKKVYMIDFGFSKKYIDPSTGRHIPDSKAKRDFIGNYYFSSVRVHCQGRVPTRRDDLEMAALMFIHLLTPHGLPWTRKGVPKDDDAHDRLKEQKRKARPEQLCRGLPVQFEELLRHCRSLGFFEAPDYQRWIEEFQDLALAKGFTNCDEFIYPPPRPVEAVPPPVARKIQAAPQPDLEEILKDLGNMRLDERPVLGERKNVQNGVQAQLTKPVEKDRTREYIVVGSDSEAENQPMAAGPPFMLPKKQKILKLNKQLAAAIDNPTLAALVQEFVAVMQSNKSRALTKEGFSFLDALHKQLADPSVFITPLRTSGTRQSSTEAEPRESRLTAVARLRVEVRAAKDNKTLAGLVERFGHLVDRSPGRTVTKDGLGFLEGLATQLST